MAMLTEMADVIKCVAVGDGFVGKTTVLNRLAKNPFDPSYVATIFETQILDIHHDGKQYGLELIDTAGQEEYENLRTIHYKKADIVLLCFSVSNMDSFSNLTEVWIPEIKKHTQDRKDDGPAMVLVGLKSDLRHDQNVIDHMNSSRERFVTRQVAENCARIFKVKYVECSAKTAENIPEVLVTIKEAHFMKKPQKGFSPKENCINPMMLHIRRIFCCKNNLM